MQANVVGSSNVSLQIGHCSAFDILVKALCICFVVLRFLWRVVSMRSVVLLLPVGVVVMLVVPVVAVVAKCACVYSAVVCDRFFCSSSRPI